MKNIYITKMNIYVVLDLCYKSFNPKYIILILTVIKIFRVGEHLLETVHRTTNNTWSMTLYIES